MTVVTMHRYIPIPAGVYNLKVLKYDQKESTKQRGQFYYSWTLQVLDALPEDYAGRDTFSILTPCELTEKNALRKFLNRVGFTEIAIDQDVDLDTLINHKFVGKVDLKTGTTGVVGNDLVDVPLAEYDRFLDRQRGGNQPPAIARAPLAARPQPAPAPAPVAAPVAVPRAAQPAAMPTAARPVARPAPAHTAAGSPPVARPAAKPLATRPVAQPAPAPAPAPVVDVDPAAEDVAGEEYSEDGTDGFPPNA